jgi:hypothetical protein
MTTLPKPEAMVLEIPPLSRVALDELYHFLQSIQFKYIERSLYRPLYFFIGDRVPDSHLIAIPLFSFQVPG